MQHVHILQEIAFKQGEESHQRGACLNFTSMCVHVQLYLVMFFQWMQMCVGGAFQQFGMVMAFTAYIYM